jgi:hypothetical protein
MFPWMKKEVQLFSPRTTYRYRYRSSSKSSVPYYPSAGVILDYYLPGNPAEDISIEVKDEQGNHIRMLTSVKPEPDKKEDTESQMANFRPSSKPKADLSKSAGTHRYVWDMRHEGPWDKKASQTLKRGPLVVPGTYTFELMVDGTGTIQSVEILADPRVMAAGTKHEDLVAQEALALKIVSLQSAAKQLTNEIDIKMKPLAAKLKKKASHKTQAKYDELEEFYYQLETPKGIYMRSMLLGQIGYLSGMLNRADQVPGKDAYERYDELNVLFQKLEVEYSQLK